MHFGENQLSRSLIGLSPLRTGHPPGFQPWWVRASTRSYPRFTLPMRRSPRFGPAAPDYIRPVQARFHYGYPSPVNLATHRSSQAHSSKGTRSHHAPRRVPRSHGLQAHGFRYYFTTPHRGAFHLSLTVLVHYRSPGSIQA